MSAEDELKELARKGRRMRQLQKHYFKTRTADALAASKRAEREFDEAVQQVLEFRTPSMFDETPEGQG